METGWSFYIIEENITFKSYYVVWKQVMVDAKAKKKEGLNRTM